MNLADLILRLALASLCVTPLPWLLRNAPGRIRHIILAVGMLLVVASPFIHQSPVAPRVVVPVTALALPKVASEPPAPVGPRAAAVRVQRITSPEVVDPMVRAFLPWAIFGFPIILLTARYLVGWARLMDMARRAKPQGELLFSSETAVPLTFWAGKSKIVLPIDALNWDSNKLNAALYHERAHIKRGDWFTLTAAYLLTLPQWWNPLAWYQLSQLRAATEEAADAHALRHYANRADYARQFLAICQDLGRPSVAAVTMASQRQLKPRVNAMMNLKTWSKPKLFAASVVPLVLIWPAIAQVKQSELGPLDFPGRSTSYNQEIRAGKTIPGVPENNWTAYAADKRMSKLEYVAMNEKGKITAWKPDGTVISAAGLPIQPPKAVAKNERMFVMSWEDPTGIGEAGAGSGPDQSGPDNQMYGRGSFTNNIGKPGKRYTASFVAYYKGFGHRGGPDATVTSSTFALGPNEVTTLWKRVNGQTLVNTIEPIESKKGELWGGKDIDRALQFRLNPMPSPYDQRWFILKRVEKDGNILTDGVYRTKDKTGPYYAVGLNKPMDSYAELEFVVGTSTSVAFLNIAINPKPGQNP